MFLKDTCTPAGDSSGMFEEQKAGQCSYFQYLDVLGCNILAAETRACSLW